MKCFKENVETVPVEEVLTRFLEMKASNEAKDDLLNQPPKTARDNIKNVFSIFIPTEEYFVTPVIVNVNILIFVLMALTGVHIMLPDNQSLIDWGSEF